MNVVYINTRKSYFIDRKCWKSFKRPTANCCCCLQFQFTPLHKAERRCHHSIVKLLLGHKARLMLQQPVRNMPMNIYILSCGLFVLLYFLNGFFCLFVCFCFVFQETLYGFGEEFFSLHSKRFKERSLVHMTQSAKRDGLGKNNCVFCCSYCWISLVERFAKSICC